MFYGLDLFCLRSHLYTQYIYIYTHIPQRWCNYDTTPGPTEMIYMAMFTQNASESWLIIGFGWSGLVGKDWKAKKMCWFLFLFFCFCVHMFEVTYRLGSPPFLVNSHLKVKGISTKTNSGVCDDETYGHLLGTLIGTLIRLNWPVTGISPSGISLIRSDDLQGKLFFSPQSH